MSYEAITKENNKILLSTAASSSSAKLTDFIKVYDKAIPNDLCDKLVNHLEQFGHKSYQDNDYLRRTESTFLPEHNPEIFSELLNHLKSVYQRYKDDLGSVSINLWKVAKLEFPVLVSYHPNPEKKESFHDHADSWHFESCSRQVSIIYYLSDVEEGGSTTFTNLDISVKPVKGRALFFPSTFMFQHRAEPPVSGTKYACICWLHFDGNTVYRSMQF